MKLRFSFFLALVFFAFLFLNQKAYALTVSPVRLELKGEAGESLRENIKLYNELKESKTYYFSVQNFESKDETGTPAFIGSKTGLASWVSGPQTVTIGPTQSLEIPITIKIPKNADPGGHFAAAFFKTDPPTELGESIGVGLGSEVGALVLLQVAGDFKENADIIEFSTTNNRKVFTSLPVDLFFRFQNTGQDRVKPLGDISIKNIFGRTSKIIASNPAGGNVLPGSIRKFESSWKSSWGNQVQDPKSPEANPEPNTFWGKVWHEIKYFALGPYTANLSLVYGSNNQLHSKAKTSFWVLPWHLLLVVFVFLFTVFVILFFGVRRYNRWILKKAGRK